jgi:hypothetical protein
MAIGSPALFLAKAFVLTQMSSCPLAAHAPRVEIMLAAAKPKYITTAPMADLNQTLQGDMDSTLESDSQLFPGGAMAAETSAGDISVEVSSQLADEDANACLYIDKVQLVISYAPTIFLAKELSAPGQECRLKMTKDHEERHVAADISLLNDGIAKMKMKVLLFLRDGGGQKGPFHSDYVAGQQHDLEKAVDRILKPMVGQLLSDRRDQQSSIDTPENLKEEKALCAAPGKATK